MASLHALHRRAVATFDRVYRFWHNLDSPRADVPPVLRIQVRRSYASLALSDGTEVRRGDRIGVLHVNNDRVAQLHAQGLTPLALGLEVRRQLLTSLHALAVLSSPGGRLAGLPAFTAVTIFHHGLQRAGFEIERKGLAFPGIVGAYQRALLASLHPSGRARLARLGSGRAERLWISRGKLLALYVAPARRVG